MATNIRMDSDPKDKQVDFKYFRNIIDSLFYLIASRTSILSMIDLCARCESCAKKYYLVIVKWMLSISRYFSIQRPMYYICVD